MALSMQHLNGNQICAIAIETTGLDPCWHEIIQICILPLDSNLNIRKDVLPFYFNLNIEYPERIDKKTMTVNKMKLYDIAKTSTEKEKAIDLLVEWKEKKLQLPYTKWGNQKHIIPLGHNFAAFDKQFITNWLGPTQYNEIFHYLIRDTLLTMTYLNDNAAFRASEVPYFKYSLTWLCRILGVTYENKHDALANCLATAECYKKLVMRGLLI